MPVSLWQRLALLRLWVGNALIAALLALICLDGLPTTSEPVRELIDPVVDKLGIWAGPWNMFSPYPDGQNHRFRAEIKYADGEQRTWESPDWRSLSTGQMYWKYRLVNFLDSFWGIASEPTWEPFAAYIAHSVRPGIPFNERPSERPREVRVIIEQAVIEPPADGVWQSHNQVTPYNESWVLFTKKYP